MPSLLISTQDDGTVMVSAVEPTPDMLEGAQTFDNLEQATAAAMEVLKPADGMGGMDKSAMGMDDPEMGMSKPGMDGMKPSGGMGMEALIQAGYDKAKKGR